MKTVANCLGCLSFEYMGIKCLKTVLLKGAETVMGKSLVAIALVGVMVLCIAAAFAGEPAAVVGAGAAPGPGTAGAPPGAVRMNVFDLIIQSGAVAYLLIFVSFVGLSLIIESAITIRRQKLLPAHFIAELEDLFENEQYEEAMQLCESEDNLLSRLVAAGLSKVDKGWDAIDEVMVESATQSSLALNQKISYVLLVYTLAPLLGLFGTVIGMIMAFATLAEKGFAANAADLAAGVSQALTCTALGLFVAIPTMACYHYFRNKVSLLDQESVTIAADLMRRFKPAQKAAS